MPTLVLKRKAEILGEFHLKGSESIISVGADAGNDMVVNDRQVSLNHFQVERQGNKYFVRDLRSAYGTVLNESRLEGIAEIHDGDTVRIGEHQLEFRNPLETEPDAQPSAPDGQNSINDFWSDVKEAVIDIEHDDLDSAIPSSNEAEPFYTGDGNDSAVTAGRSGQRSEAETLADGRFEKELSEVLEEASVSNDRWGEHRQTGVEKSPYYLLVIHGPYLGKRFQLNFGETRIGRDSKLNDIVIRENRKGEIDPSISRRHATISYRDNTFYLNDKRSKSRSYLNQRALSETDELPIAPGDEIEIVSDQQSTIFRFVAEGNWDFEFPKRGGTWWLRYRSLALKIGTGLVTVAGLVLGAMSWYQWSILANVAEPLVVEEQAFARIEVGGESDRMPPGHEANGNSFEPKPVAADFNGDDHVDLAVMLPTGSLHALDGNTKRRLWRTQGVIVDHGFPLTVADLNDDDYPDLIALTADQHLITIDGRHGAEIWTSGFYVQQGVGPAIVGDFDGDGTRDIAIINDRNKLQVGYAGGIKPEWVVFNLAVESRAPLACADLNGDGADEVLIGTERGLVIIYNGVERRLSGDLNINMSLNKLKGSFTEDNHIRHPVGAARLNQLGGPVLVVSSAQGNLLCFDIATRNADGSYKIRERWWASIATADAPPESHYPFVLGDLNDDGLMEVVVADEVGNVYAFVDEDLNGNQQTSWWQVETEPLAHPPQVFDFNGNGCIDVLLMSNTGTLLVVEGKSGQPLWRGRRNTAARTGMPLLADMRRNTRLDIVSLGTDGVVYTHRTNRRVAAGTVAWGQRYGAASNLVLATSNRGTAQKYVAAMIACFILIAFANLVMFTVRRQRRNLALACRATDH